MQENKLSESIYRLESLLECIHWLSTNCSSSDKMIAAKAHQETINLLYELNKFIDKAHKNESLRETIDIWCKDVCFDDIPDQARKDLCERMQYVIDTQHISQCVFCEKE